MLTQSFFQSVNGDNQYSPHSFSLLMLSIQMCLKTIPKTITCHSFRIILISISVGKSDREDRYREVIVMNRKIDFRVISISRPSSNDKNNYEMPGTRFTAFFKVAECVLRFFSKGSTVHRTTRVSSFSS